MTKFKGKYVFILILIIGLQSCSKFDEGPLISFRTKKQRISRSWKIEYSLNLKTGIKHSGDFDAWLLSINEDGSYSNTIYYGNSETIINGSWTLNDNLLSLKKTETDETVNEFYTIIRLTTKELWVKTMVEEIHFYSE